MSDFEMTLTKVNAILFVPLQNIMAPTQEALIALAHRHSRMVCSVTLQGCTWMKTQTF